MDDVRLVRASALAGLFLQFALVATASAAAIVASTRLLQAPPPGAGPKAIYFATLGLALGVSMCLLALVPLARLAVSSRMLARADGEVLRLWDRNAQSAEPMLCLPWREIKEAFNGVAGISLAQGETVKEAMTVRVRTLFSLLADGAVMALAMATLILASAVMERSPPTSPASPEHVAFELALALLTILAAIVPLAKLCRLSAIMLRIRRPFLFVRVSTARNRGRVWYVPWSAVKEACDGLSAVKRPNEP